MGNHPLYAHITYLTRQQKTETTHEAYALRVVLFGIPDNLAKTCTSLNGLNVYVSV